jgi:hypothetical protein
LKAGKPIPVLPLTPLAPLIAEKLRQGDRNAPFPSGSFPPALPFVAG